VELSGESLNKKEKALRIYQSVGSELKNFARETLQQGELNWEEVRDKIARKIEEYKVCNLEEENRKLEMEIERMRSKTLEDRITYLEKELEFQRKISVSPRKGLKCYNCKRF